MATPHILVVGGTGMLAGLSKALAGDGERLSLLSRQASAHGGFDCDYYDEASFQRALDAAIARSGPVTLAIAWFHSLKIAAPRMLAEQVRGRMFQVMGHAMGDPERPDRLATAAKVAEGLPECILRQVVLGFRIEPAGSRWLNNDEISTGVLNAVQADLTYSVIGQTEPWSARPRA